jgi:purine-binding chemotaxis protein CheW
MSAAAVSHAGAPQRELLRLEVADEVYAVPVERVREIVGLPIVTRVPRAPRALHGVISLRGEILEVVDLRRRLGLEACAPGRRSRVLVLHGADGSAGGLLVDSVRHVMRVSDESMRAPASGASPLVAALCRHGQRFVSILDLDRVMDLDAEQ